MEMKPGPNGVMRDMPIRKDDDRYDAFRYMEERLAKIQRQINPRKSLPHPQGQSRPSRVPLAEYDRFIIENRERLNRERAAEMAAKARQKFSIPA